MLIILLPIFFLLGKHVYERYFSSTKGDDDKDAKKNADLRDDPDVADEFRERINEENIKFNPPVYVQRYQAVTKVLEDPKYKGKLRKVIDFGCAEMNLLPYLKEIRGVEEVVFVDINGMLLEYNHKKCYPLCADYLNKRSTPFVVHICEGCATQNDRKLVNADVVICIEFIEHLNQSVLERVTSNIFEFIKPKVVIITTPNADFNIVFKMKSKFRHIDHKFEWTRKEFQDWAERIVNKYPPYNVTFQAIGFGPDYTKKLGGCTQMAIFHQEEVQEQIIKQKGIEGLFETLFTFKYPYEKDTRSDEQKLFDRVSYYINYLSFYSEYDEEIPLIALSTYFTDFTIDNLKSVLLNMGKRIEEREIGPVIIVPQDSIFSSNASVHDDDLVNDDGDYNNEDTSEEWDHVPVLNGTNEEISRNYDGWDAEPSIVIPQNCSIIQENTYLFDGETLPEQDSFEEARNYDNNSYVDRYSNVTDTKELYTLPIKQGLPNFALNEIEFDNTTQKQDSIAASKVVNVSVSRSSMSSGSFDIASNDSITLDQIDLVCTTSLLNSTFNESQINETITNVGNPITCVLGEIKEQILGDNDTKNLIQDTNEKEHAEEKDAINRKTNIVNNIQETDYVLSLDDEIKHKDENVFRTLAKVHDVDAEAHLETVISDIAQSDKSERSLNSSRELLSSNYPSRELLISKCAQILSNSNEFISSECAKEINALDDTFQSCKSNGATDNALIQFLSVLSNDMFFDYDREDSMSMDVNLSDAGSLTDNVETNLPSSAFETPPDSLSHEIMDSGYPNSASAQDITPENDLSSIAQDHIPDIESPSIVEAPRFDILEPIEVENGDLANNNRDDEGNNMIAADANDIEGLQPLIDVLENDLENENDIYVLENGFPAWLLRLLDNPLDLDIPPQQNRRVPNEAAGNDGNYILQDEGFDSYSDDSECDD